MESPNVTKVYEKLTGVLRDAFDDDDLVATPALTANDVDGWDSLAHVRLMLAVEQAFGVRFKAAEVNGFKSVGDLADTIAAKLNKN